MYDPFIKRGSERRRSFWHKFQDTALPHRITLHETINKLK
jgi:hypothetical protein